MGLIDTSREKIFLGRQVKMLIYLTKPWTETIIVGSKAHWKFMDTGKG